MRRRRKTGMVRDRIYLRAIPRDSSAPARSIAQGTLAQVARACHERPIQRRTCGTASRYRYAAVVSRV
jgi:hypothetical protein